MRGDPEYNYWDSSVFISYLNRDPSRIATIDEVIRLFRPLRNRFIVTSALTIAEVAKIVPADRHAMSPSEMDDLLEQLWTDPLVKTVDITEGILKLSRPLIRLKLSLPDAIHLATAAWVNQELGTVVEVNTYDDAWSSRIAQAGKATRSIVVCEPHVEQLPFQFD